MKRLDKFITTQILIQEQYRVLTFAEMPRTIRDANDFIRILNNKHHL